MKVSGYLRILPVVALAAIISFAALPASAAKAKGPKALRRPPAQEQAAKKLANKSRPKTRKAKKIGKFFKVKKSKAHKSTQ